MTGCECSPEALLRYFWARTLRVRIEPPQGGFAESSHLRPSPGQTLLKLLVFEREEQREPLITLRPRALPQQGDLPRLNPVPANGRQVGVVLEGSTHLHRDHERAGGDLRLRPAARVRVDSFPFAEPQYLEIPDPGILESEDDRQGEGRQRAAHEHAP